jgi:hypothetical protein
MTDRATSIIPLGIVLWLCGLATALSCCGSNVPSVTTATDQCLENMRAIVARPGTTYAEDLAALEAEDARCDAARAAARGE